MKQKLSSENEKKNACFSIYPEKFCSKPICTKNKNYYAHIREISKL